MELRLRNLHYQQKEDSKMSRVVTIADISRDYGSGSELSAFKYYLTLFLSQPYEVGSHCCLHFVDTKSEEVYITCPSHTVYKQ